jgi:hypothetical protein
MSHRVPSGHVGAWVVFGGLLASLLETLGIQGPRPGTDAIPWQQARDHIGRRVTVAGVVERVQVINRIYVLEFAPDDPSGLRVKLLRPLFTSAPVDPQTTYEGKQVRATGVVRQFRGSLEIVVDSPAMIALVTADPATTAKTAADTEELAPPSSAATVRTGVAAVAGAEASADRCTAARARWREMRPQVQAALDVMDDCMGDGRSYCRKEAEALAAALAELGSAQRALEAACQ